METLKNNHIKAIETSQKNLSSSGLVLQAYCNSILQQPDVDFSSVADLSDLQEDIADSLTKAKKHANSYLNDINHKIINSLSNLNNYFTIYRTVPVTLPVGYTVDQWLAVLSVVKSISEDNLRNSEEIVNALEDLRKNLNSDADAFETIARRANEAIEGDNGELEAIGDTIKEIDKEIKGQILAIVGEGIAIAGGVFTIATGAIASFVTAGTSAELVVGGVVVVTGASIAMAASIITLTNLYKQKANLFQQDSKLRAEITLLAGVDSAFKDLSDQAEAAAVTAKDMVETWKGLTAQLENLIDDLRNGILTTDQVRELFLKDANNEIAEIQETISVIRQQMAGVIHVTVPDGNTVLNFLEVV